MAAGQGLFILDASEIQARKQGAQFEEISELDWPERTIPQVAQPITIGGRPYLAEIDEFSSTENDDSTAPNGPKVGAARIIDIADERTRGSSPTSGSPSTSARTGTRSPATPGRRASSRATRATTATSRAATTPRSSPAR